MDDVEIQASRSSDGQKMIVAEEHSDLRIVCETRAAAAGDDSAGVEWTVNTFTTLNSGTDRVEMSERSEVVDGQRVTLHTLVIHRASTMDIGTYECRRHSRSHDDDSPSDRVHVKIVRLASRL